MKTKLPLAKAISKAFPLGKKYKNTNKAFLKIEKPEKISDSNSMEVSDVFPLLFREFTWMYTKLHLFQFFFKSVF